MTTRAQRLRRRPTRRRLLRRSPTSWWPRGPFFELHPPRASHPVIKAERVIERLARTKGANTDAA